MKVIIIEDDAVVAVMQKMWLSKCCSYQIEVFPNGLEAVNYLDQQYAVNSQEEYLVFLDLNMPVMDGWEFLEVCERKVFKSRLYVIVVTSSKFKEDYERVKESNLVLDLINKPLGLTSLQKYIKIGKFSLPNIVKK